jgi:hypothetical protein
VDEDVHEPHVPDPGTDEHGGGTSMGRQDRTTATRTRTDRRRLGVVVAAAAWAVGPGLAAPAAAAEPIGAPAPASAPETDPATERVWVLDGEILASRLGSVPSTGYGVDYAPSTSARASSCPVDAAGR